MNVLFLALLLQAGGSTPVAPPLTPTFAPGQSWTLRYVLERTDRMPDGASSTQRLSQPITLEVLAASAEGAELAWTEGRADISSEGADPARMVPMRIAADATEGATTRIKTNADGVPTGVANVEELTARVKKALEPLTAKDPGSPGSVAAAKALETLTTPGVITASSLKTPSLLLTWGGAEIAPGETISADTQLDNPIGGPPFPAKTTFSRAPAAEGATVATLKMRQVIDSEAGKDAILKTVARLGVPEASASGVDLAVTDEGEWVVDLATGMPREMVHVRTIRVGPQERVERRTITVTPGAAP